MNDSATYSSVSEHWRPIDRRGFLRRAGTMAAGGVGAAALLKKVGEGSSQSYESLIPAAPMVVATAGRPNAPYFFRIETTAGGAAGSPTKEV